MPIMNKEIAASHDSWATAHWFVQTNYIVTTYTITLAALATITMTGTRIEPIELLQLATDNSPSEETVSHRHV